MSAFPGLGLPANSRKPGAPQGGFRQYLGDRGDVSDGNWDVYFRRGAKKPNEGGQPGRNTSAAGFRPRPPLTNGGTVGTRDRTKLVLSDFRGTRYANGDGKIGMPNGDANSSVLVDGKQNRRFTLTATAHGIRRAWTQLFYSAGQFSAPATHWVEVRADQTTPLERRFITNYRPQHLRHRREPMTAPAVAYSGTDWNGGGAWFLGRQPAARPPVLCRRFPHPVIAAAPKEKRSRCWSVPGEDRGDGPRPGDTVGPPVAV